MHRSSQDLLQPNLAVAQFSAHFIHWHARQRAVADTVRAEIKTCTGKLANFGSLEEILPLAAVIPSQEKSASYARGGHQFSQVQRTAVSVIETQDAVLVRQRPAAL